MDNLCGWYGISRQAHYQMKHRDQEQKAAEAIVVAQVQQHRHKHPRMGTRKLHHELAAEWADRKSGV